MRKAERLLKILTLLQGQRRAITAAVLARRFNVSLRTIYRDIQALELSGVSIVGEAGVGYMLQKGSVLAPLMFDEEELEALILGVRMVQGWGDAKLGSAADSALLKIRSVIPERLHYLQSIAEETLLVADFDSGDQLRHSPLLREAIKRHQVLRMSYVTEAGEKSERDIWPLGLVFWGKVWTLVAWCELRNAYRTFRVDRISALNPLGVLYELRPDRCLKDYLEQIGTK